MSTAESASLASSVSEKNISVNDTTLNVISTYHEVSSSKSSTSESSVSSIVPSSTELSDHPEIAEQGTKQKHKKHHKKHRAHDQEENNDQVTISTENESIEENGKNKLFGLLKKHSLVSLLCLLVAFGGFVFGWDTGTISGFVQMSNFKERFGELNSLTNEYEFSNTRVGLIISIFNIGCAIGGVTLAKLGDTYGRKIGLMSVMVVYIVGIVLQISSFHWIQYMVGRIVSGLAVGAVSVLSPMFIAETSPSEIRGVLVSCYQLMITLGILLGYVTTFGTVHSFTDTRQWRIPLGLCFAWAIFMIVGMLFLPESARFLVEHNRIPEAKVSLARINNCDVEDDIVVNDFKEIETSIIEQRKAGEASWKELFSNDGESQILTRVIIGVALQSFQQLTGNNYFFYYGTSIFKSIGLEDSFVTSIILGMVNFLSTFIALYSVGKIGRRDNLIFGAAAMALCLLVFASIGSTVLYPKGYDQAVDQQVGGAMVWCTCMFIMVFAITWAPGVFVVVSETYPLRVRSKGMALATAANWIWGFLIAFFTPAIVSRLRFSYGYIFFGATFAAMIFVLLMVPETENLTLEKIDELYTHYKPFQAHLTRTEFDDYNKLQQRLKENPPKPKQQIGYYYKQADF
ncbi:Hxt14 protein [Pichia kluyveri]|uniref:Hxt14 protein n=1 Tax=Pichia kluyveri TaxID=36015 RepID=A0AAV5QZ00_PICKL|nr:Hxt14 protein [Pichia kluyveri]